MSTSHEYAVKALAAMRLAAEDARKRAAMHGLKIPVWKDGRIVYLDPIKDFPSAASAAPPSGQECIAPKQ